MPAPPNPAVNRVLLIEDEENIRDLLAVVLKSEELAIDVASDGREALPKLAQGDYRVVICDLRMPNLDGEKLYRSVAPHLQSRFLFLTGDYSARTCKFLENTGCRYVYKPFGVAEFTSKLREALAS